MHAERGGGAGNRSVGPTHREHGSQRLQHAGQESLAACARILQRIFTACHTHRPRPQLSMCSRDNGVGDLLDASGRCQTATICQTQKSG